MELLDDRTVIRRARGRFAAMVAAYGLGVFNDSFFRQSAMLLAVTAGRPGYQGVLMAVFTLPYLLAAAPAGWLADRFPKRHVVIATKALELSAMICGAAGLIAGSWALLTAMVFVMGLQSCLFNPALTGSIPELYPSAHVTRANATLKAVVMAMIVAGMALAGAALSVEAPWWLGVSGGHWLVAGGSLVVSAAGLAAAFGVPRRPAGDPRAPFPRAGPGQTLGTLWRLRRDPTLAMAVVVNAFVWSVGALLQPLVNNLSLHALGLDSAGGKAVAGCLLAAEMVGIALGGLLAGRRRLASRWQDLLTPSLLITAGALGALALLPGMPGSRQVVWALALMLLAGVGGGLAIVSCEAFIQVRPPAGQRGSTIAASNFVVFAGILLAAPVSSLMLWLTTPTTALASVGALCLSAGLALRALRGRRSRLGDWCWLAIVRGLLALRYRVCVAGLGAVARRGRRGILFLANHPALIDPIILHSRLFGPFRIRSLADAAQIDRPLIRRLARRIGVIAIPDPSVEGAVAAPAVREALARCAELLRHGENLLLYPAGRTLRGRYEDLGGSASADLLLQAVPEVRVVLVRTRGLWGSGFSRADGRVPSVARVLRRGALGLLASGVFFAPRRTVSIELAEPADVPPGGDRRRLNRYLEAFFNVGAEPRTVVPHRRLAGPTRIEPEPGATLALRPPAANAGEVSPAIRQTVTQYLRERAKVPALRDGDDLGRDLGMDSLDRADLAVWLSQRFGVPVTDGDGLRTVGDVLLSAWGEALGSREAAVAPPAARWFSRPLLAECPEGLADMTVPQAFLHQARRGPGRAMLADAGGGVKSYRDVATAILALRAALTGLPGERLGILLPAGVAATTAYLATLFAGKTPVMINWTLGRRALSAALDMTGVQAVLTARRLINRLDAQGVDLAPLRDRLVHLEDLAGGLGRGARLVAALRARLGRGALDRWAAQSPATAAVLFTSGSEGLPKAVPLSHRNILGNLAGAFTRYVPRGDDVVLGMLPPFHAFGLTGTMLLGACLGARVVYWPNPADGAALARTAEAYRATMLITTPTFLRAILRAVPDGPGSPLGTVRLVICGAEACPPSLAEALARACPGAVLLEGYGVTECSPIITFNDERVPRPGTIGRPLESYEVLLRDERTGQSAPGGSRGELLVRGPCVFGGYLGRDVPPPWVQLDGRQWYPTGDVVSREPDGVLRFVARRRRFVKRGGEMISLPAIESALAQAFDSPGDGPALAVVAVETEGRAEVVLFTTDEIPPDQANRAVAWAGLSPLHAVNRVVRVESLPLLGTGKVDYRALEGLLYDGP